MVGLSLEESGAALLLPYMAPFAGCLASGQVSDWLIRSRGWKVVRVRKTMQATSDIMLSLCVFYFVVTPAPTARAFTIIMAIGGFFKAVHIGGYWTNIVDIGPRYAGPLMGISNTVAALPGVFANLLTGYILDVTGSWSLVFLMPCVLLLIGCATFVTFARGDVVFR